MNGQITQLSWLGGKDFEMGRLLYKFYLSRFAFYRRGVTSECLKIIGKLQ